MAADIAVRVEGIGKQYRVGQVRQRYPTLRDALAASARSAVRRVVSPLQSFRERSRPETFWALRNVSFEVSHGEVVGIIGRNGAGKSTLLKILSRITEPTEGSAVIHGRVGSLLEVGTGFHPELTGRENVYLNGAILGMTRGEIERKFDEIVSFAEVERFIDTPVKHYSSGMYLRLAFAVAAHLEPEILIVDEVLAVGDASFQKKCLGKMGDVAREGRTVLFVSHNMDAVQRLCTRCLMLRRGLIAAEGPTASVVAEYLSREVGTAGPDTVIDLSDARRSGSGEVRFGWALYRGTHETLGYPSPGGSVAFHLGIESDATRPVESLAVTIRTLTGTMLVNADVIAIGRPCRLKAGSNTIVFEIEQLHLNPGHYVVGLWASDAVGRRFDHVEEAFDIEVVGMKEQGLGVTPRQNGAVPCRFEVYSDEVRERSV